MTGAATVMAAELLDFAVLPPHRDVMLGGVCCHCIEDEGLFCFAIAESQSDLDWARTAVETVVASFKAPHEMTEEAARTSVERAYRGSVDEARPVPGASAILATDGSTVVW